MSIYIMVTAILPYKQKYQILHAELLQNLKTPLDNQLQYKSHIVRNLFLSRPNKPEELKRKFGHPKSPQPDVTVGNQQGKQPE